MIDMYSTVGVKSNSLQLRIITQARLKQHSFSCTDAKYKWHNLEKTNTGN